MRNGKIYKMIIDSGSFDNLVSYEMVNKLGLKKFPIDKPYKASWVSDTQNIVVREQAIVDLSIGEYKDQVLCDVIPMTCYHVILGRPCQASRNTIHFGSSNVYVVHKDGVKFQLNPLPDHEKDMIICFGKKEYVRL